MGSGASQLSPLDNTHGNHAVFHQQLVNQGILRRQEMIALARSGQNRYQGEAERAAQGVLREVQREELAGMRSQDLRTIENNRRVTAGRGNRRGRRD